jgi:hypothetical protein
MWIFSQMPAEVFDSTQSPHAGMFSHRAGEDDNNICGGGFRGEREAGTFQNITGNLSVAEVHLATVGNNMDSSLSVHRQSSLY